MQFTIYASTTLAFNNQRVLNSPWQPVSHVGSFLPFSLKQSLFILVFTLVDLERRTGDEIMPCKHFTLDFLEMLQAPSTYQKNTIRLSHVLWQSRLHYDEDLHHRLRIASRTTRFCVNDFTLSVRSSKWLSQRGKAIAVSWRAAWKYSCLHCKKRRQFYGAWRYCLRAREQCADAWVQWGRC